MCTILFYFHSFLKFCFLLLLFLFYFLKFIYLIVFLNFNLIKNLCASLDLRMQGKLPPSLPVPIPPPKDRGATTIRPTHRREHHLCWRTAVTSTPPIQRRRGRKNLAMTFTSRWFYPSSCSSCGSYPLAEPKPNLETQKQYLNVS